MEIKHYHFCRDAVAEVFRPGLWPSSALDFDDLVQETALAVHEFGQAQERQELTYEDIRKVARNIVTRFYRRERRRSGIRLDNVDVPANSLSPESHIFGSMNLCIETEGHPGRALFNRLSSRDEKILWYYLTDGECDAQATAKHCSVKVEAVYNAVSNAYRIAEELHQTWLDQAFNRAIYPELHPLEDWPHAQTAFIDLARNNVERNIYRLLLAQVFMNCSLDETREPRKLCFLSEFIHSGRSHFERITDITSLDVRYRRLYAITKGHVRTLGFALDHKVGLLEALRHHISTNEIANTKDIVDAFRDATTSQDESLVTRFVSLNRKWYLRLYIQAMDEIYGSVPGWFTGNIPVPADAADRQCPSSNGDHQDS